MRKGTKEIPRRQGEAPRPDLPKPATLLAIAEKTAHPIPPSTMTWIVIVRGERHVRMRERYSLATIGFHKVRAIGFIRPPPRWLGGTRPPAHRRSAGSSRRGFR